MKPRTGIAVSALVLGLTVVGGFALADTGGGDRTSDAGSLGADGPRHPPTCPTTGRPGMRPLAMASSSDCRKTTPSHSPTSRIGPGASVERTTPCS